MHQTLFEFWVAMPDNVDGMDSNPTYGSLKLELDSLPQRLLIGYDRKATDELFERLDASYQKLSREREHLRVQVEELSRRCAEAEAERNEVELRARAELDEIRSQLARVGQREKETGERLLAAEEEAAALRDRNLHLDGELETSRLEFSAAQDREGEQEARIESADRELADMREREDKLRTELAALTSEVTDLREQERKSREQVQNLDKELARYRDRQPRLEAQLEQAEAGRAELLTCEAELTERCRVAEHDLAAHRRRELVVAEMFDSAKRRAEKTKADARAEANMTLKKARERRVELLESTTRDVKRVEAQKERLKRSADELRAELSTLLTTTLDQLKTRLGGESVTPLRAATNDTRSGTPVRMSRKPRARRSAG